MEKWFAILKILSIIQLSEDYHNKFLNSSISLIHKYLQYGVCVGINQQVVPL